jgi:hypothetical protein
MSTVRKAGFYWIRLFANSTYHGIKLVRSGVGELMVAQWDEGEDEEEGSWKLPGSDEGAEEEEVMWVGPKVDPPDC